MPPQGVGPHRPDGAAADRRRRSATYGQPIALVVADTFEQARAAAHLVRAAYDSEPAQFDLRAAAASAAKPQGRDGPRRHAPSATSKAPSPPRRCSSTQTYTTPLQTHAMMEPHATIARWDGGQLTLWTANQMLNAGRKTVAATLKIPPDKVRLISRYIGGGFGAKLWVAPDAILAAARGAQKLDRPVKVALDPPAGVPRHHPPHRHRPAHPARRRPQRHAARDRPRGAGPATARVSRATKAPPTQTRSLYAGAEPHDPAPAGRPRHCPVASAMRAPGEAVGLLALECAMDELAEQLGLDPIELRVRNEPDRGPGKARPVFDAQAAPLPARGRGPLRLGQAQRQARPGPRRALAGRHGRGRRHPRQPAAAKSSARVRLDGDGVATVQTAMTDIGTGTYTILAQIAAEMLGLPIGPGAGGARRHRVSRRRPAPAARSAPAAPARRSTTPA